MRQFWRRVTAGVRARWMRFRHPGMTSVADAYLAMLHARQQAPDFVPEDWTVS